MLLKEKNMIKEQEKIFELMFSYMEIIEEKYEHSSNDNNVSWRNAFVLIFATMNVEVGLVRAFSLGRD